MSTRFETSSTADSPSASRENPLLSPQELSKLTALSEEFVQGLAAKLSSRLHLEFSLKLGAVEVTTHRNFAASWAEPTHLTLFKLEPLRRVSVLEITPELAHGVVDRLMGGPGRMPETPRELTDIENSLLEETSQMLLEEWCGHSSPMTELKPVILGSESCGRFVQTAPPEAAMLVISLDGRLGGCAGLMRLGLPLAAMEPLIRKLNNGEEVTQMSTFPVIKQSITPAKTRPATALVPQWNNSFDEVTVPLTVDWQELDLTAREVLALKVGDVLPLDSRASQQASLRVADQPKFHGRAGTIAGQWAVELTRIIQSR